jgi:hypothetical protein
MSVPRLSFPPPRPAPPAGFAPALIAGAVAALVGAGIWAAVTALTSMEIGWIAWGVGGLVGFVMSKFTPQRGVKLGVYAALLAALGLAIGKVATVRMMFPSLGRELVMSDGELLAQAFAADMRTGERYSAEVSLQLAALSTADTVPPALLTRMLDEAQVRMANSSDEEKERVAQSFAQGILADVDIGEQFRSSLSLFDLLWFGLGIATAFKLMRGG